jgi:hypothetical protein
MSIGSYAVVPGASFEVAYLIQQASCLEMVVACLEHVIGKLKLGVDVVSLALKLTMLVINAAIAFNLRNGVPAVLVCDCLAEGMKCGTRTCEQVVEPYWHRLGSI